MVVEGAPRKKVQGEGEGEGEGEGSSTFARPGPFLTVMPCTDLYSSRNSFLMSDEYETSSLMFIEV